MAGGGTGLVTTGMVGEGGADVIAGPIAVVVGFEVLADGGSAGVLGRVVSGGVDPQRLVDGAAPAAVVDAVDSSDRGRGIRESPDDRSPTDDCGAVDTTGSLAEDGADSTECSVRFRSTGDGSSARAIGLGIIPTAMPAVTIAAPAAAPPIVVPWRERPSVASCRNHDVGPIARRSFPIEMSRNARTISGSNWVPEQRVNSIRPSCAVIGFLYERAAVITSNTSATATSRPALEISWPTSPFG